MVLGERVGGPQITRGDADSILRLSAEEAEAFHFCHADNFQLKWDRNTYREWVREWAWVYG